MKANDDAALIFDIPTQKDLLMIQLLSEDPFYRYVFKEVPTSDDKDPLKFFQYIIRNKDQKFIGYLQGFFPQNHHDLWIQKLLIDKSFLHQGYGTNIIERFIHQLRKNEFYHNVYLTCHKDNMIGHRFWSRLGFKKIKDNIHTTHVLYSFQIRS